MAEWINQCCQGLSRLWEEEKCRASRLEGLLVAVCSAFDGVLGLHSQEAAAWWEARKEEERQRQEAQRRRALQERRRLREQLEKEKAGHLKRLAILEEKLAVLEDDAEVVGNQS